APVHIPATHLGSLGLDTGEHRRELIAPVKALAVHPLADEYRLGDSQGTEAEIPAADMLVLVKPTKRVKQLARHEQIAGRARDILRHQRKSYRRRGTRVAYCAAKIVDIAVVQRIDVIAFRIDALR